MVYIPAMKEQILNALESCRGEYISGEDLAESLGVTRAAVWKAVSSLRKEGHKIIALQNKGYCLKSSFDSLTASGIASHLKAGTKVKDITCLIKTDSTNNFAKHLALGGGTHGTLIAADCQTAGRGRRGHSFESPAGKGLYMSLILRPDCDAEKFQMITIADAVAVCLAVEDLYPESRGNIGIKWVNDVLMRGKKICGILTEALTGFESGEIESVVTGIGINVYPCEFPESAGNAGSILEDDKAAFTRNELCARIADYIMEFAENLDDPAIIAEYRKRSVLTGHEVSFMKGEKKCYGHADGIDDTGGLLIRNESGETETLRSGEVFMIRDEEKE